MAWTVFHFHDPFSGDTLAKVVDRMNESIERRNETRKSSSSIMVTSTESSAGRVRKIFETRYDPGVNGVLCQTAASAVDPEPGVQWGRQAQRALESHPMKAA